MWVFQEFQNVALLLVPAEIDVSKATRPGSPSCRSEQAASNHCGIGANLKSPKLSYSACLGKACDCRTVESTLLRLQYLGNICKYENARQKKQIHPMSFCILLPCLSLTSLSFQTLHVHRWSQGLGRDSRRFKCTDTPICFAEWKFWQFWNWNHREKSLQIWQFRLYHPSISTQPWRIYLLKAHKAGPTCPNDKDESLVWSSSAFLINDT